MPVEKAERPSLDQRLEDIEEGVEESEIQAVIERKPEGTIYPKKTERRPRKEDMLALVKRIDDLSQRFPAWSDDVLLKTLRRLSIYQTWPVETLKGLLFMKTTTVNRLKKNQKPQKEVEIQTEEEPRRWTVINRVTQQEQVILIREQPDGEDENVSEELEPLEG